MPTQMPNDKEDSAFYFPLWDLSLREQIASYRYFYWLTHNQKSLDHVVKGLSVSSDFSGISRSEGDLYKDRIFNAFYIYSQQMIVVAVTFLESIIDNFLDCVFFWQPDKRDRYAKEYSDKYKPLSKKLKWLTTMLIEEGFETDWNKELGKLIVLRNRIAHQILGEILLPEDVESAFKSIMISQLA
jgi:hypothetical protein